MEFHCRCCNQMKRKELRRLTSGQKVICADCLAKKLPPSMTRENQNDPEVYKKRMAEGDWKKPFSEKKRRK